MKRYINYILAVFTFITAMSLITSCEKEQQPVTPDNPAQVVSVNDFDIAVTTTVHETIYMGDSFEIPFEITKGDRDCFNTNIDFMGGSINIAYNGKKGTITVKTSASSGKGSVIFQNKANAIKVDISYQVFYLNIMDNSITLSGEGEERQVRLNTNLPVEKIKITSDTDWLETSEPFVNDNGDTCITVRSARNETNTFREGTATIRDTESRLTPAKFTARQDFVMVQRNDVVSFIDRTFMEYMISIADKDGDRFISFDEALGVKEIDIEGKGVKDLTGLEYFKNVKKFNGKDNQIEDATVLKELSHLYWVDLKGNKNLKTFDLTGCSVYFEHRDFEVTEDLQYYMFRQQIQKYDDFTDQLYTHGKHIVDPRESTDYSRQGELTLIKGHTAGNGYPLVYVVWGAIDVDVQDGTYERLVRDAMELQFELDEEIRPYKEYFDVYMLIHIRPNRNEYRLGHETTSQETREAMEWVRQRQAAIYDDTYDRLVPDSKDICEMYMQFLGLNTASRSLNTYATTIYSWDLSMPGSDKGIYSVFNINGKTGDETKESYYPGIKTSLHETMGLSAWIKAGKHFGKGEFFDIFVLGTKSYNP